jgi:uncharacterized protein (TIGR02453 family)
MCNDAAMAKSIAADRFQGFADTQCKFFKALAKNQSRAWFQAHKEAYDTGWAEPMKLLLDEVRAAIDPLFPHVDLADEPKLFRIYRDVRFSKDKSPYKTHVGGMIAIKRTGKATEVPCALYVQVGAEETFAAAGHYMMDAEQLARYRAAVLDDKRGKELEAIVRKLERAGYEVGSFEELKKCPRGIDPDHPRAVFLKRKGLVVSFPEIPAKLLTSKPLVHWIVDHTRPVAPLVEWLAFATA